MILGIDVCPLSPPPHVLPDPQKEAPLTELPQREMLPFLSPPLVSKIPSHWTPQVPQWTSTERGTRLHSCLLYLCLKVPVNEPTYMFSNRVPMEREASSPETMVYSFIYMSESPIRSQRTNQGKYLVTVHGAPRGQKAYIQWVAAWFHEGIVYDTAVSTPVPCSLQHDTFHLGLRRPEPS